MSDHRFPTTSTGTIDTPELDHLFRRTVALQESIDMIEFYDPEPDSPHEAIAEFYLGPIRIDTRQNITAEYVAGLRAQAADLSALADQIEQESTAEV